MRRILLLVVVAASGCAAGPSTNPGLVIRDDDPIREEAPGYPCRKPGDREFVGQLATTELGARMVAEARARTLRWIPPNAAVTMDFSPNRLNVHLDARNRVVSLNCG